MMYIHTSQVVNVLGPTVFLPANLQPMFVQLMIVAVTLPITYLCS